ncbi:MAG: hypothetical protein A2W90_16860 [Bacteroidetes bacterium GWF2_42_66]|nr:MAG: hypothetical protein A2W92_03755 [Bacteroidetes bacterium GWA2_42_15]OFX96360.1 MAG: hypothetical protein A2W89_05790 [Bacteroidetes bacterium GWE2_42_39]OFY46399.1 MAG: hypothetical protein A2W90_16860 [Bacteroidetes bacterium GWF2_42_66]HAZ03737.1 hypothetical protein [Marinilabiliales bacterium]HBL78215.1 hypothetical protein [Prolixibacteraceae bacterium]
MSKKVKSTCFRLILPMVIAALMIIPSRAELRNETPQQFGQRMVWWREVWFGMFILWGLYTIPAGEWPGKVLNILGSIRAHDGSYDSIASASALASEDASAIPEMLLLNLQPEDVVIGITASGFSYYVQSALSFAKDRAALSVLIQAHSHDIRFRFCNDVIPLYSGNEVVAGSTRMKAGTSSKKLLNFLSTSVMIKLGKVTGSYMTDLQCLNSKLVQRALNILEILYSLNEDDAFRMLKENNMSLNKTIKCIQSGEYFDTKHSLSDEKIS